MLRSTLALVLLIAFALVGFVWRTVLQVRRYGDTGWRFVPGRNLSAAVAHGGMVIGLVMAVTAPMAALTAGEPHRPGGWSLLVDGRFGVVVGVVGAVLMGTATVVMVVAQVQMGASWRIGVDERESTELVTTGLFSRVRNPIFAAMLVGTLGLAMLVPNATGLGALVVTTVGIQVQVRRIEEPYLRIVHGAGYEAWGRSVGRFVPGIGHLR